jgi:hypothetical protein
MALYNVISYCLQDQIKSLNCKMQVEEKVDFDQSRYIMGVSEIFSFNESLKKNKIGKSTFTPTRANESTHVNPIEKAPTKYEECIKMMWRLKNIENPLDKIQLLVKVINQMKHEIDTFWQGVDIGFDDKVIDADNMEKLLSYVIVKSKYQKIVVDLQLIDYFSGNHIDFSQYGFIYTSFAQTVSNLLTEQSESSSSVSEDCETPAFVKARDEN